VEWNQYFAGHWNFNGERQDRHLAMFPEELPKRLIKMFSFINDLILDPFLGSGTTTLASINLERNSIGYEINKKFLPVIKEKIGVDREKLFIDFDVEFLEEKQNYSDYKEAISKLPYVFKDPVKINSKIDPKKLQFGSKIDSTKEKNINFYSVKKIINPEKILLNNNLIIRLIGIKVNSKKIDEAVKFLELKLNKQRIFLKFDSIKYDKDNNLFCYLYLKNKTFLNAHLIKNKLVEVDESYNYRYKMKFINLSRGQSG
jgi:site-specific DNA-methyltransferase (adenine-specific)